MSPVYRFGYTLFRLAGIAFYDHRVIHKERLIQDGPVIVVSNHVSYVDPPMVGICYDDDIFYLARKSLFVGPAKWFYEQWNSIPVDQENPDFTGLKSIIKIVRSGERVLIFPEGNRSPDGQLQKGEAGVGLVVAKSRCRVQPVRIFGAHEALPRGTSIPRPSRLRIVVGHPIEFSPEELAVKGREAYQAISDRLMDEIGSIKLPEGI
ncbi:MAG: 1-acyl-sn-glycerol-3-phosphate acyltransferase [Verrucomicrobiales bacterium]|jgi:1-acyl-sn-glycerol-3-phosphate acyltransferase